MADTKRRSARQRAERKRSVYFEPDTDDDFDEAQSDAEADYQPAPDPAPSQTPRPKKKRKVESRRKPETRGKEKRRKRFGGPPLATAKRRGLNWVPSSSAAKTDDYISKGFSGPSDGRIPDWRSLPAHVLRQIFVFASQPIHDQSNTNTSTANTTWLMRTARTCRSFAVPALEAFYESPAILTTSHPHDLLDLFKKEQDELYINYKYRVQTLSIDTRYLTYVAHNKQPFQVAILLEELPRLQNLEILRHVDSPPYRQPHRTLPWQYPSNFFESLEAADVRLKAFRWTRDLIPADWAADVPSLYSWMTTIHASKPFQYLERLVVCGYGFKDGTLELLDGLSAQPHGLATSISSLPLLKDLTFISCDVIMEKFFEHLPMNLERIELSNCLELTSDFLSAYLMTSGAHLRELVLNHNASLNLAFLQQLQAHCPKLEVLKMDLTYYSERFNSNDAIALYNHLLEEEQIPTWPSTLRHLELLHLQKWEAEAAQNLFRSLVEGARDLPDLRHLVLQAHINIPWRDRAHFRDQWIERLQRIYLRKKETPNPYLGSMRQFRLWKDAHKPHERYDQSQHTLDDSDDDSPLRRRLSHVRVTPAKAPADAVVYEQPSGARPRRSTRVAENQSQSATTAEESSSESEGESDEGWRKRPESFIQGLCNVVDIRIDNQRPRENQYTEANFLDSEPSGDEDWREGADGSDDERYAW